MVGVLVREDERPHIALVESQLVHAVEDLAACKAVVDHDEPLGPLHQRAVPARAAAEDVQVQGVPTLAFGVCARRALLGWGCACGVGHVWSNQYNTRRMR